MLENAINLEQFQRVIVYDGDLDNRKFWTRRIIPQAPALGMDWVSRGGNSRDYGWKELS